MSRMIFVNLPVADLDRSVAFYETIGGSKNPKFTNERAAAIVFSNSIYVMLLTHDFYRTFTAKEIAERKQEVLAKWHTRQEVAQLAERRIMA